MAQQRAMDQSQQAFNEARDFLRDGAPYVSKEVLSRIPKTAQERHSETAWKQLAVEALTSWGIESSTRGGSGYSCSSFTCLHGPWIL